MEINVLFRDKAKRTQIDVDTERSKRREVGVEYMTDYS